jgi:SSS family solute:Na+ symporter
MFYVRAGIIVFAILGTALSTALPGIDGAIVWLFAWMLPAFWVLVFGLLWKRSTRAAFWTLVISGVFNMFWSLTSLPSVFHLEGNNNSVGLTVVAFVISIILTATDKDAKPGMIQQYKKDKRSVMSKKYLAELDAQKK